MMNRKMRVGIVGGGSESFMGPIHRAAIEKSGCVEMICGAFGSTRHSSFETGKALRLPGARSYGTYRDMFRREAALPQDERMDFLVILAPNTMHYPVSMSACDAHFPILSEKPFTCNLDEAINLTRKLRTSGLSYGIAFNLAGYPMLQQARELIQSEKAIGALRKVVTTYLVGWMAPRLETAGNKQAGWRADPRRCGPLGSAVDLGVSCLYLTEWTTGLVVSELCADLRPTVAGRILDDDASLLVRFVGGARGVFLCSQVATGSRQGLAIDVYGDKGSLSWVQSQPDRLIMRGVGGAQHMLSGEPDNGQSDPDAALEPYGKNPAFIAALAETYRSFAAFLDSPRKASSRKGGLAFATMEEGLRTVAFVDAVMKNVAAPEEGAPPPPKWTPVVVPPVPDL